MVVHVLDKYYLAITLLVTIAYQLTGFAIAWIFQFDKITDFTGGSNFFLLALLTLLMGQSFHARNIVASVLVMIWATRLGGFLLFRVLKRGSDARFDQIRARFLEFLGFWVAQIIWVWVVSLPVIFLNSPAVTSGIQPHFGFGADIAGILLFVIGWVLESVADAQKYRFKSSDHAKDQLMTTGLWRYSRHPSYAGEIILWWGIWVLCLTPSRHGHPSSSARAAQSAAVVSPLLTMALLIFASGMPTAEKPVARRYYLLTYSPSSEPQYRNAWANYKDYFDRTSPLWPASPAFYQKLPRWVKTVFFVELPMFRFEEGRDGPQAREEERVKRASAHT